ncbi:MAG: hypothetical protein ACRC1D_00680 [Culicoidibacterales bacterium]
MNFEKIKQLLAQPIPFITLKGAMEKQIVELQAAVTELETQFEQHQHYKAVEDEAQRVEYENKIVGLENKHQHEHEQLVTAHTSQITEYQAIIVAKDEMLKNQADLFEKQEQDYTHAYKTIKTKIEEVIGSQLQ